MPTSSFLSFPQPRASHTRYPPRPTVIIRDAKEEEKNEDELDEPMEDKALVQVLLVYLILPGLRSLSVSTYPTQIQFPPSNLWSNGRQAVNCRKLLYPGLGLHD